MNQMSRFLNINVPNDGDETNDSNVLYDTDETEPNESKRSHEVHNTDMKLRGQILGISILKAVF